MATVLQNAPAQPLNTYLRSDIARVEPPLQLGMLSPQQFQAARAAQTAKRQIQATAEQQAIVAELELRVDPALGVAAHTAAVALQAAQEQLHTAQQAVAQHQSSVPAPSEITAWAATMGRLEDEVRAYQVVAERAQQHHQAATAQLQRASQDALESLISAARAELPEVQQMEWAKCDAARAALDATEQAAGTAIGVVRTKIEVLERYCNDSGSL